MTLTEFLTARIAEDEAAARAAIDGDDGTWTAGGVDFDGVVRAGGFVTDSNDETIIYDEGTPSYEQAAHIARHDPARVLAEVAAKRRILELLEDERQRKDIYNRDYPLGLLTTEGDLRARTSANARWAGLEAAVRALVLPYVDHPDFWEDWTT